MATRLQKAAALRDALSLVLDGIALAEKGLLRGPSKEEERELTRLLGALAVEKSDIKRRLDDVLDGDTSVTGPTPLQVQQTATLSAQVRQLTNQALVASAAVRLATDILGLASEIA